MNMFLRFTLCLALLCGAALARAQDDATKNSNTQAEQKEAKPPAGVTPAKITSRPEPEVGEQSGNATEDIEVVLRMILRSNGKVTDITIVKGAPDGLTEAAIKAAKKIKFTPAMKDGHKVSQWVTISYIFHVSNN
ncbi:MAG: hypothetical protein DMF64_05585 [Acidobacteria bacterium]|nr:MAG: hypothetical protein DMF64_05585 [Acidobacteriota bacterium]